MVCSNFNILCVSDCKNLAKFIAQTTTQCEQCMLEGCCTTATGTCLDNWLNALTKEDSEQYKVLQKYINTHIVDDNTNRTVSSFLREWAGF